MQAARDGKVSRKKHCINSKENEGDRVSFRGLRASAWELVLASQNNLRLQSKFQSLKCYIFLSLLKFLFQ